MPALLGRVATVLGVWAAAAALLWWGRLPGPWRRALAIVTSAAGLVFLILALNTQGLRESATTAVFLMGRPYVTEQVYASASLPYYVATALCLFLGTLGLSVSDETAHRLRDRWLATAIVVSLAVTGTRFWLEKVAAPDSWSYAVGITWMAPVVGAFFLFNLRREGKGLAALAASLLVYGLVVRAAVAALMVAASTLRLGSHYDISALVRIQNPLNSRFYQFAPGSFGQVLTVAVFPQLAFWPVYTVAAGLLGAGLAAAAAWAVGIRGSEGGVRSGADMAPARGER
jgi:hypothetical protein